MPRKREVPILNPFDMRWGTSSFWAKKLGYAQKNCFQNKLRKFGQNNPETWMTAEEGRKTRIERCRKMRKKRNPSTPEWKALKGGSKPDPKYKGGSWERKYLSHLGR